MDCFVARAPRNDGAGQQVHANVSKRSFQSGFSPSIKADFLARLPALICFSRVIASIMLSSSSCQTRTLQPYVAEDPFYEPLAVLERTAWQVGCNARVEGPVTLAR